MSTKKTARQQAILSQLESTPSMRGSALADVLGVTTETIRRDLEELATQGLINRTYGGAVLRRQSEPEVTQRHSDRVAERTSIARAAMPRLGSSTMIMIGSGATTVHVARRLVYELNNVTVVTHSFGVATALSFNPTIRVLMAPGSYHSGEGALHGSQTVRFLSHYAADWAVLGASAIDGVGPSDALVEAADVYATMMENAAQSMVVADHSKFGAVAAARYAGWAQIDALVTDAAPPLDLAGHLSAHSVEVILADR
ncbi:MAG: DeoR/GlpR family DNA-binding transcription regulator [Pseudomonadota bacterium]